MEVLINQQAVSVQPDASLLDVLNGYGVLQSKGVAVAVNETVVPTNQWEITRLQPDDRVIIIKAAQGG
jgi:thiamine biosynthesis protein ThiS